MTKQYATPCPLTRLMPNLYRRARRLSANRSDAEDLVQDTLVCVIAKQNQGDTIDNLPAYAMTTLHNQARLLWRKAVPLEELEDDCASTPPVAMKRLECAETLRMITKLPPDQAKLMTLVCHGETSPAVLARETCTPVGTVMSRLARARARLRARLESTQADG